MSAFACNVCSVMIQLSIPGAILLFVALAKEGAYLIRVLRDEATISVFLNITSEYDTILFHSSFEERTIETSNEIKFATMNSLQISNLE